MKIIQAIKMNRLASAKTISLVAAVGLGFCLEMSLRTTKMMIEQKANEEGGRKRKNERGYRDITG